MGKGKPPKSPTGLTQNELILAELKAGKVLTPLDALRGEAHSFRLGARIFDLRQEGWNIVSFRGPNDGHQSYVLGKPERISDVEKNHGPEGIVCALPMAPLFPEVDKKPKEG